MFSYLCVFLISTCLFSQTPNQLALTKVTLQVKNIKAMEEWYTTNLGLTIQQQNEHSLRLTKDQFRLELKTQSKVKLLDDVRLKDGDAFIAGYYKYGFVTNELDVLYDRFTEQKLSMAGGVISDKQLNCRSFILIDPEGNYIQFFENTGIFKNAVISGELKLAFLMLITPDYVATKSWYQKHGFKEASISDNPSRNIIQRTLFNGNVLLEISELTGKIASKNKYPTINQNISGIISIGYRSSIKNNSRTDQDMNIIEWIER